MQSTSSNSTKQNVYSSTIGGYTGGTGSSGGGSSGGGGAITVPGGSGGSGGGSGGGTGGGTGGGGSGGGGAVPIDSGGGSGGGGGTGGGSGGGTGGGGSGVNPGGSTGGSGITESLVWQYQPEDRTVEEGEVLTLSSYATKGIDLVTYQWYKNGQAISGQTSYMYRSFLVPTSAAGTYYVVAKSGTATIQSISITVKVKAARNPCLAGYYGVYPATRNYKEYWHESMIGRSNTRYNLQTELADAYTISMPYEGFVYLPGQCLEATATFQCRNGKLIATDQITCTRYYDAP